MLIYKMHFIMKISIHKHVTCLKIYLNNFVNLFFLTFRPPKFKKEKKTLETKHFFDLLFKFKTSQMLNPQCVLHQLFISWSSCDSYKASLQKSHFTILMHNVLWNIWFFLRYLLNRILFLLEEIYNNRSTKWHKMF